MEDLSQTNNNSSSSDATSQDHVIDKNHPAVNGDDNERSPPDGNEDVAVASARGDTQSQMESEDLPQAGSSGQHGVDKNKPAAAVQDIDILLGDDSPKLFTMSLVNSYGSSELKQLEDDDRPIRFRGGCGINWG